MKQRILTATNDLVMKYGIRSVSMDDIARHIAISKKTIYQYYEHKDEVVHELMKAKLDEDEKAMRAIDQGAGNVVEVVLKHMEYLRSSFSKINPSVLYDLQKYHPSTWKLFAGFKESCILKMVEDILSRGIRDGFFRADIHIPILARMRLEQIEMGFNPAIFPSDKFKLADVQVTMLDHFLYGICTLKGYKLINKYKQITDEE